MDRADLIERLRAAKHALYNGEEPDWAAGSKAIDEAIDALSPPKTQPVGEDAVERAVVSGWNACRKSVYAVCEDIQNRASDPNKISLAKLQSEQDHERGYYFGEAQAAKSIARGFNAMEAMDDDNLRDAIANAERSTLPVGGWRTDMENAPRDGNPFIVRYLPYLGGTLCMRRVRWVASGDGVQMEDMGAWLLVSGIDDDFGEHLPTSGDPSWSVAADGHNDITGWVWQPLPSPSGGAE